MTLPTCPCCARRFRSKAAAELAHRFQEVNRSLRDGVEVPHLRAIAVADGYDAPTKRERHLQDVAEFRSGQH